MKNKVYVIGGGLAGTECAWQLAGHGIETILYEMKPKKFSPAHTSEYFAELVCSNSLKAKRTESASGLLKKEMELLGSITVPTAYECSVPAGGALAVDRDKFSFLITEKIKSNKYIKVINEEISDIPEDGICVIATGPLTSDALTYKIKQMFGDNLSFYDAEAPIITEESIDKSKVFSASRYDKGEDSAYINCPMEKEEYLNFIKELTSAERAKLHEFEKGKEKVYEGCMPVEVLASRGEDALRYGPMKPVGLRDPRTDKRPYAVVQLRRENLEGTMYNIVGFQTNLKMGEQKRVFGMIPGLENADYIRYGVMHRNTFINSPEILDASYNVKNNRRLYFAGQITGVEGYMESASSGIIAGINASRQILCKDKLILPDTTVMGSLAKYISCGGENDFQPMGANFGIIAPLEVPVRKKEERYVAYAERSIKVIKEILEGESNS